MGMLHMDYLSQILGYHTNIYYILPECTKEGKLPAATLYLLHSEKGNGMDWMRYTALERYAEQYNISVVMPEVDGSCFYADMKYGYRYFTYLTEEVVAVAQGLLPVNKDSRHRLAAGASMGGYGAYKWAFYKPEFFRAVAGFSPVFDVAEYFDAGNLQKIGLEDNIAELNWGSPEELKGTISDSSHWLNNGASGMPELYAACATKEPGYEKAQRFLQDCRERNISIYYEEVSGTGDWGTRELMLRQFLEWSL